MPISSTDVSNIIAGQIGMFSASSQYSQAISAQYGFAPSGAPYGGDPRSAVAGSNLMGGAGMASTGARMPGMAMGGLGAMAMFNAAPRMLDPFTSTMHAGAMGMRSAGIGGAIGMGGMTALGYGAMASAGSWMTNQVATGAQNRGMITSAAQGMMPGSSVGGLNAIAGQVEGMSRQGMGSIRELTGLMQGGAMSGSIDTGSLQRFSATFQKLVSNVRQVAVALNTTMSQAQQAMQQVEGMGISNNNAAGFLGTSRAFGAQVGIGPQQMMQYAAGGASFARGAGIDRSIGATGAITQAGIYGMANRNNLEGILPDSYSKHMQGASRFLMSGQGKSVLGAMMDPRTGELNQRMAQQMSAGLLDRNEILATSKRNLAGNADMFGSRRGELAATFLSQYGPSSVAPSLGAMTSTSSRPGMTQQALTGLTRNDLTGMKQLNQAAGGLQSQLVAEAKQGFQEGSRNQTLGGALGQAWENLIKPVREEFRQLGAGMTKSMQGALQSMTEEFVRAPPAGADPRQRLAQFRSAMTGHGAGQRDLDRSLGAMPTQGAPGLTTDYGPSGALSSMLPQGFRIGKMGPGTTIDELSGFGMGSEEYNPYMTAGAWGSRATLGGRNALGWAGRGLNEAGRGIAAFGGTGRPTGFMGMGGIGGPGSVMRGAGNLVSGAGWAARGIGFAARTLAPVGIAADLLTNLGPAGMRRAGYSPITSGAITGDQRGLVQSLGDAGALGDKPFEDIQVNKISGETPPGMTPLGGFVSGGGGGSFGTQRFMTKRAMQIFRTSMAPKARNELKKRIGQGGRDKLSKAVVSAKNKNRGNWEGMSPGAQLTAIQKEAHASGSTELAELTTADVFSLVQGTGAISDEALASETHGDPAKVAQAVQKEFHDRESMQLAEIIAEDGHNPGGKLAKLSAGGAAGIVNVANERMGDGDWASMLKDATTNADQNAKMFEMAPGLFKGDKDSLRSDWKQRLTYSGGAGGGGTAGDLYQQGVIGIDPSKFTYGGDAFTESDKEAGAGTHGSTARRSKVGHRASMRGHLMTDEGYLANLSGLQEQYRDIQQGGMPDKQERLKKLESQAWRGAMGVSGFSEMLETMKGDKFRPNAAEEGKNLLAGEDAMKMTASIRAEGYGGLAAYWKRVQDAGNASGAWDKRQGATSLAMGLSGGTRTGTNRMMSQLDKWYFQDGDVGQAIPKGDPQLEARQSFISDIQARLKAGSAGASDADIKAGVRAGGAMTMDDAMNMQASLMESSDVGVQDLGSSLGTLINTRQNTRTKAGKKRTAVQVLKGLGVKTGKLDHEDLEFLSDKSDVMSSHLESQFNNLARQALNASMDTTPNKAEIDARSGQISAALRKGNIGEYENLVSTTGAPRGVGPTSGKKSGGVSAATDEFVGAMKAASGAARTFTAAAGKKD